MNNKESNPLKDAIVQACPDIMELKFGCEIRDKRLRKNVTFLNLTKNKRGNEQAYVHLGKTAWYVPIQDFEILGRKITLADVLATFVMRDDLKGKTLEEWAKEREESQMKIVYIWNLRDDDLDHQSPETTAFLTSILVR